MDNPNIVGTAWIVTHPETDIDREGRLHGNLDGSLDSAGQVRAKQIAKEMSGKPVKRILSSPKLRARQTAEAISKTTGAKVHVLPDLAPWNAGSLSGAKVASVKPVIDHYAANPEKSPRGGEPKQAFLDRFKRVAKIVRPGDVIAGHSQHALELCEEWRRFDQGSAGKREVGPGQGGEDQRGNCDSDAKQAQRVSQRLEYPIENALRPPNIRMAPSIYSADVWRLLHNAAIMAKIARMAHRVRLMKSMSAKSAKNGFGLLLDTARAEPVTIEKHGRGVVVVLSVEEYERLVKDSHRVARSIGKKAARKKDRG